MPYSIGLTALLVFVACNNDPGQSSDSEPVPPAAVADPGF
jgi:hypothetical protein